MLLTHMPRIQSKQRSENIQPVGRSEGEHDIPEYLIAKHRSRRYPTLLFNVLDACDRKVYYQFHQLTLWREDVDILAAKIM